METMKLQVATYCPEKNAYEWCVQLLQHYFAGQLEKGEIVEVGGEQGILRYNPVFWRNMESGCFDQELLLNAHHVIAYDDGTTDYLMTALYYVNTLFEKGSDQVLDEIGRKRYEDSVWIRRGIAIRTPFVNRLLDELAGKLGLTLPMKASSIWLSHDIDSVYGAWKEDGKKLLKHKKFGTFVRLAAQHFLQKPQWLNLTEIAALEAKYGMASTFFMLTEKGKIDQRKVNSDYGLFDKGITSELQQLHKNGIEIGLHKSLSPTTYQEEAAKLGAIRSNRNHYLAINWPSDLYQQAEAGIRVDASLGYAEEMGFRNGYSLPFFPFDIEKRATIPVLECPLHIMDGTFSQYKKCTAEDAFREIHSFLNENTYNAVISVLWHNSHFTNYKYKGFPAVYSRILDCANELQLNKVTLSQIEQEFTAKRAVE